MRNLARLLLTLLLLFAAAGSYAAQTGKVPFEIHMMSARPDGFELTFTDARVFTVAFRHAETAVEAEPVLGFPARSESDFYRLTLRLMEI